MHRFRGKGTRQARAIVWIVAMLAVTASSATGEVFFFRDAEGVLHFTNVPDAAASSFRPLAPLLEPGGGDRTTARGPADQPYDDLVAEYAGLYDVEPALVKAVIRAESSYNRLAVSPRGARGLMQLMPGTAKLHDVSNVWSPSDNIRGGVKHLRLLLDRYGMNLPWVLAAYNAGTDAVERYRGVPPYAETEEYVGRVLRFRREYLRRERLAAK